ncbi:MAG: hypothetical protein AAFP70_01570, partial [Calditrichota bacterium]
MIKTVYVLFCVLLLSCNNSEENKTNSPQPDKPKDVIEFRVMDNSSINLSESMYEGNIVYKKAWQDLNGKNIVIFTNKEHELFAYHYAVKSGEVKLLRRVYDFTEANCEFDLFADFIEKSITVTDLNNDNYGEITFAYQLACISDVSPKQLKLLMLQNGEKYIIRGQTEANLGYNEIIGGDKKIDASFEKAPPQFLEYAVGM